MPVENQKIPHFSDKIIFLLCGFGAAKWGFSATRLSRQLKKIPLNTEIRLYKNRHLPKKFPDLLNFIKENFGTESRGFGYWIWKPYIINQELKHLRTGEILVYIDAGCELVEISDYSMNTLKNYLDYAKFKGVLVMDLESTMNQYCEIGIANYFGLSHAEFNNFPMISATMMILSGNSASRNLVEKWLGISLMHPKLLSGTTNYQLHEGFIAHRHDQSILSGLIHRSQIEPYTNEIDFNPNLDGIKNKLFYAARNKHLFSIMPKTFFGKAIRIWWKLNRQIREKSKL